MPAVVEPAKAVGGKCEYVRHTFRQLDEDSSALARGLVSLGVTPGMRLALLVRPGFDFVSLVFALLKSGAVQVLVDPGLGRRNALSVWPRLSRRGSSPSRKATPSAVCFAAGSPGPG